MKSHIASIHEEKRIFSCPNFEKGFSRKDSLRSHTMASFHKLATIMCSACDNSVTYDNKHDLLEHIFTAHEKIQDSK